MKKLVLLLFLLPLCFSFNCNKDISEIIFNEKIGVGFLIGIVLAFDVSILLIAYMLGSTLNNPQLLVFSKDELFHLLMSVVIFVCISGMFYFFCIFFTFLASSMFTHVDTGACPPSNMDNLGSMSLCFLNHLSQDTKKIHTYYLDKSIKLQRDSGWSITIELVIMGSTSTNTKAYRKTDSLQYETLANTYLVPAMVSIGIQRNLFNFLSENLLNWVLPFGFLFRMFSPTRQLGNMLIAFAVGAYIFLPLMYTFNAAMYYSTFKNTDCEANSDIISDNSMGGCTSSGSFWEISKFLPQAFFLPNLTIAVFITFLAAINKALKVIG